MRFLVLNQEGGVELREESAMPEGAIVVTDEEFNAMLSGKSEYVAGAVVPTPDRPPTAEKLAAEAKRAALRQLTLDANADALMTQLASATLVDIWQHVNDTFPALNVAQRKTIALALAGAAMVFRERG